MGTNLLHLKDFNVKLYGGTKSIVISTTTVMGGKNPFLGIAYVIVGGLCVLLGAIFAIRHLFKPRFVTCRLMARYEGVMLKLYL